MRSAGQKVCAFVLACAVAMAALAVLCAPAARADTTVANTNDRFSVDFVNNLMSAELVYDKDPIAGDHYMLGAGDGVRDYSATTNTLRITLNLLNNWPAVTACALNISAYDATSFDFNDPDHAANSEVNSVPWTAGLPAVNASGSNTFDFAFDVLKTSGLGSGTSTELTMKLWYAGGGSGTSGNNVNFNVRIYLSSVFADDAGDGHGIAYPHLADVSTGENDAYFEAGDVFADTRFQLRSFDDVALDNMYVRLTPPATSGITLAGGKDTCWIPGGIAADGWGNASYRTNVPATVSPGRYVGATQINYTRADSGLRVIESGADLNVDWPVNFNYASTDPMPVDELYSEYQNWATSVRITEEPPVNETRMSEQPADGDDGNATLSPDEGGAVAGGTSVAWLSGLLLIAGIVCFTAVAVTAVIMRYRTRK